MRDLSAAAAIGFVVLAFYSLEGAATRSPDPAPSRDVDRWRVEITNEGTSVARIEDRSTATASRVYPGQTGVLMLHGTGSRRTLRVEVAFWTFDTQDFAPSDDFPCWQLQIDAGPPFIRARSGPWPCRED